MKADIASLERRVRELQAHGEALSEALTVANRERVQLHAQITVIRDSAALRIQECVDLIDQLHGRIEVMVDAWQADIRGIETAPKEWREERLAIIEPFRPVRIGGIGVVVEAPPGNQLSS